MTAPSNPSAPDTGSKRVSDPKVAEYGVMCSHPLCNCPTTADGETKCNGLVIPLSDCLKCGFGGLGISCDKSWDAATKTPDGACVSCLHGCACHAAPKSQEGEHE